MTRRAAVICSLLFLLPVTAKAQADSIDDQQISAVIERLYETISFTPGGSPDWDGFRALFLEDAILLPRTSRSEAIVIDPEQFIDGFNASMKGSDYAARGFREYPLETRIDVYGRVAHAFSAYWMGYSDTGEHTDRGVNSIQLVKQNGTGAWKIATIAWDSEAGGAPPPFGAEK